MAIPDIAHQMNDSNSSNGKSIFFFTKCNFVYFNGELRSMENPSCRLKWNGIGGM